MRFSMITPCFNAEPYIGRAMRSMIAQTYSAHEVIAIDDGSTDWSIDVIARSGVEVKLLRTQPANAAGRRQQGLDSFCYLASVPATVKASGGFPSWFRGLSFVGAARSLRTNDWLLNKSKSPRGLLVLIAVATWSHRLLARRTKLELIEVD